MMLASAAGRIVLPMFKRGEQQMNHVGERLPTPIGLAWSEPGVKHGQ
jgi:hypothetical protein